MIILLIGREFKIESLQIATGFKHTLFLGNRGQFWATGDTTILQPMINPKNCRTIVAISAGYFHKVVSRYSYIYR